MFENKRTISSFTLESSLLCFDSFLHSLNLFAASDSSEERLKENVITTRAASDARFSSSRILSVVRRSIRGGADDGETKLRYHLDPDPSVEAVDPGDSDFSLRYRLDLILGICIAPYCEI
jgi:hypothetical protein